MKVAIVHDFLREYGGAERVVEALHGIYHDAPIYTAFVDYEGLGPHKDRVKTWDIRTTWAQNLPLITKLYSPLRFLAPFFFRSLNLSEYDVIISSSNAYYAKGIRTRHPDQAKRVEGSHSTMSDVGDFSTRPHGLPRNDKRNQVHICYCHTPPRSLYGYATAKDWKKNPLIRAYGTIINHFLRMYDFKAAQAVDYFIANSEEVKRRIEKFYRRDSRVIYPPVSSLSSRPTERSEGVERSHPSDVGDFSTSLEMTKGKFYLYVGRLTYSKHVDLAIEAANKLQISLKIVGKGSAEQQLRQKAGKTVEFLGEVSDEELDTLYTHSHALIFTAEDEDFGIVPVEAMAHGVSVIAHRSGGVVETVVDGKTGILFDELTIESLIEAIKSLDKLGIKEEECRKQAQKFSKERFQREIREFVQTQESSVK